ncbi:MAG: hypothetical protein JXB85_18760 [Anaerolineales bacterium]|nr:hypothetical protein [Anaerolineales bacterium]
MKLTARQLFVIVLFLGLFTMALRPVADPDFWWHLRTGQWIAENQSTPRSDPFSYTNFGKEWVAHEWLSELVIYGLHQMGGFGLLIVIFALIITVAFGLVYLRSEGQPYVAGFALLLGALATAPTWGVRPQIFSFLLSSLFLLLLDRFDETGKHSPLIPLPFLMLLWVNLHAGFALGIGLIGVYGASELVHLVKALVARSRPDQVQAFRRGLALGIVILLSGLAVLINPNGTRMFIYPFETLHSPSMQQFIQEWFSPDFHLPEWQPLAWLLVILIAAGLLGRQPVRIPHLLLTLIFAYATLRSMRHVPLFALAAIPLLAGQAAGVLRPGPRVRKAALLPGWAGPLLLAFLLLAVGFQATAVLQEQPTSESEAYPVAAVDWIITHQPEGNIYNTYGWGGYLIWRLYPDYLVYIDGRADLYGDEFIYDYLEIYRAEPGWQARLEASGVTLALLEPTSPLANAMLASSEWQVVYANDDSVLLQER